MRVRLRSRPSFALAIFSGLAGPLLWLSALAREPEQKITVGEVERTS
jgi:hypothetical protein